MMMDTPTKIVVSLLVIALPVSVGMYWMRSEAIRRRSLNEEQLRRSVPTPFPYVLHGIAGGIAMVVLYLLWLRSS